MHRKPELTAKAVSVSRIFNGFFKLDQYIIDVDKHDGGTMQVKRLILERGHSVAILAYDPKRDEILLVNQFSPGAFAAGDAPFGDTLPAGAVDTGEDILETARRELKEEANLDAKSVTVIHPGAYASGGGTSERIALVLAIVDIGKAGGVHGHPDEHEDLKSVTMKAGDFIKAAHNGELRDMDSFAAALYLAHKRPQIRRDFNKAAKDKRHSAQRKKAPAKKKGRFSG